MKRDSREYRALAVAASVHDMTVEEFVVWMLEEGEGS